MFYAPHRRGNRLRATGTASCSSYGPIRRPYLIFIQLDDAYLGGERSGGKRGRGAPGKTPFVAAVETNEAGHPHRVKLTVVEGFRLSEIAA